MEGGESVHVHVYVLGVMVCEKKVVNVCFFWIVEVGATVWFCFDL